MTLSTGYTLMEKGADLTLIWLSPTLPLFFTVLAMLGLVLMPLAFFFRARVAPWTVRHLHWGLSARALGFLAPTLSILCGAGLLFARPARPVIEWRFTKDGLAIQSLNGPAKMAWSEVASVRFDDRAPDQSNAALVLQSTDKREIWLILEWLVPTHRQKVLDRVNAGVPRKAKVQQPKTAN